MRSNPSLKPTPQAGGPAARVGLARRLGIVSSFPKEYSNMAMKESVGSLRAYFIVVALLAGFQNTALLVQSQENIVIVIMALLGLGFAIAYLYIGIALRKLLIKSSKIIIGVILVSMGFQVVVFLLYLLVGVQAAVVLPQLIIGLLITWYLLKNVKRLSSEEQGKRIA